jgi:23S rRNA (cytidine2498-2'-O)-methyltransferase
MSTTNLSAYLVPEKFLPELKDEIHLIKSIHENLVIAEGPAQKSVWAQCIASNVKIISFQSIGEAAKILRTHGRNWAHQPVSNHRRAQLIQEQLPKVKDVKLDFLGSLPNTPFGIWSLIDKNTLLFSAETNLPFPLGEVHFNEDKNTPPSRAYLKLWELFTVYGLRPKPGSRVIDFGSCPGGWTWVLQQIGCQVLSIDKAPLDARVAHLSGVEFLKADAFSLKPEELGPIDWFFSDIICYPPKLFELVKVWKEKKLCSHFVCTIKFQGETDYNTIKRFENELGARVVHLFYNKHEVTAIIR